ncbi:MAG TPA: ATP-binding protein [Acidobacteria bacterium]|nr:ATP-binding protein [Acidobacteriota bacterium]
MREGRARAPWSRNVNVNQLLADLFDALQPLAEERAVRLVPDFEGVAILDWGVPPDLVYAFENLMENGIKYSEHGGEVTVRLRVQDDRVTVTVEDRGIGIPDDFLEEVLLEFVRAPNAKKHAPEGTGLGLAIAREAVEGHGGTLVLASREGGGTTATITLPVHVRPANGTHEASVGSGRDMA